MLKGNIKSTTRWHGFWRALVMWSCFSKKSFAKTIHPNHGSIMLQIYGNRKKKTCWDIWPPWGARKALREKEISQVIGVKISFKIKMCWKGCKNFEWQNIRHLQSRVASDVIFPKVTCDSDANVKCYLKIGWYANIGIGYSSNMSVCVLFIKIEEKSTSWLV